MNWQTNSVSIRMRNTARTLGLTRLIGRFLARRGYEAAFDDAMLAEIGPGDTVWDVGANIGYYTAKFSDQVGVDGRVLAFEPFPQTVARLVDAVSDLPNVTVVSKGLGRETSAMKMVDGGDKLGANSRIVEGEPDAGINVEIMTADEALDALGLAVPNVVKIDTESFELDVLLGMSKLLMEPTLRALFIEVHFSLLADRGLSSAPSQIERLLTEAGFKTQWVDSSHIAAIRDRRNA